MSPPIQDLPLNETHIWYQPIVANNHPQMREYCWAWMNDAEKSRYNSFMAPNAQRGYLWARAMVRSCLSRYVDVQPSDWHFDIGRHGKPSVKSPHRGCFLRFNLSHNDSMVVIGITRTETIGVDVESKNRQTNCLKLSKRFFASIESQEIEKLQGEVQQERFINYWTLKEAYIKARGKGLAIPLDKFWFTLSSGESANIAFSPELRDHPDHWQFSQFSPDSVHQIAVALKHNEGHQQRVSFRPVDWLPITPETKKK